MFFFLIGIENYVLTSNTDFSCSLCYRYARSLLAKTAACLKLIHSLKWFIRRASTSKLRLTFK